MWAPHIRYRISLQTALTLDCSRCGICRFKQAQEVQPDYVQYQPAGPTVQNMSETDTDTEYNNDGMNYSVPAGSPNKYKMDSLSSSSYIEDSTVKTEMENHASDYNAILEVQEECICTYCTFGIPSTNSYDAYAKQYLMAVLFSCKFCKFRTDDFDAYNVHTWNHLSYRYYICNFCPFTTFDESTIELHNVAHGFIRIPTYDCRVCGFRTREADDATKHLVGHLNFYAIGLSRLRTPIYSSLLFQDYSYYTLIINMCVVSVSITIISIYLCNRFMCKIMMYLMYQLDMISLSDVLFLFEQLQVDVPVVQSIISLVEL